MNRTEKIEFFTNIGLAEKIAHLHNMTDAEFEAEMHFAAEQAIKDADGYRAERRPLASRLPHRGF